MQTQFLKLVRFLSVLCLGVWTAASQACAQTPIGLKIEINAGHAQLTVMSAVGTVCQIQWTDNLSSTSRWFHLSHCVLSNSPAFLTDSNIASATARYYRAVWTPSTNLVWIPPGTFTMGSPTNEVDRYLDEEPQTAVTLSRGFWMEKYLVTQADYLSVVGSNPSFFQGDTTRPVEQVSWNDATGYCALLTAQEQAVGRIPTNSVYRLPTEAEWEYACRAGTTTRFYYGDDLGYTNLVSYAWYLENNGNSTRPVGQKLPNAWGLYDMAGNVFEWCQDWYDLYPGGSVTDPQGPGSGFFRVNRGGCWYADAKDCRSALRGYFSPTDSNLIQGFRVLLAPGQP
jgi:formylglycine-generating enzyme required for sulfatase activity